MTLTPPLVHMVPRRRKYVFIPFFPSPHNRKVGNKGLSWECLPSPQGWSKAFCCWMPRTVCKSQAMVGEGRGLHILQVSEFPQESTVTLFSHGNRKKLVVLAKDSQGCALLNFFLLFLCMERVGNHRVKDIQSFSRDY